LIYKVLRSQDIVHADIPEGIALAVIDQDSISSSHGSCSRHCPSCRLLKQLLLKLHSASLESHPMSHPLVPPKPYSFAFLVCITVRFGGVGEGELFLVMINGGGLFDWHQYYHFAASWQ